MAKETVRRRQGSAEWPFIVAGLNLKDDIGVKSRYMLRDLQNIAANSYYATKRKGTTQFTNTVSTQRGSGAYNWVIPDPVNEEGMTYYAVGGKLHNLRVKTQAEYLYTLEEGFETYSTDAELNAVWTPVGAATLLLWTASVYAGTNSCRISTAVAGTGMTRTLSNPIDLSGGNVSIYVQRNAAGGGGQWTLTLEDTVNNYTNTQTAPNSGVPEFQEMTWDLTTMTQSQLKTINKITLTIDSPAGSVQVDKMEFRTNSASPYQAYLEEMTTDISWQGTEFVSFESFGRFCVAFNGKNAGIQMTRDNPKAGGQFMIRKAAITNVVAVGTGSVNGTYKYKVRGVRETEAYGREYMGAMSDASVDVTASTTAVNVHFNELNDNQVTHYYIYRTENGGDDFYYHDSKTRQQIIDNGNIYTDTTAATDTSIQHADVFDQLRGIKWVCRDDKRMIYYGQDGDDLIFYWSDDNIPQQVLNHNGRIHQAWNTEGDGKSTGCVKIGKYLVLFREKGLSFYQIDSNGDYQLYDSLNGIGCAAPWSIHFFSDLGADYVSFYDQKHGYCILDAQGRVRSLKNVRKQLSDYEVAFTNVEDELKKIDKAYRRFVSCCYHDGILYCFHTTVGNTRNTRSIRYLVEKESWYGVDTGRSIGKMISRATGLGPVGGNGEILGCDDSGPSRFMNIANGNLDDGAKITGSAFTNEVGSGDKYHKEFQFLTVNAKVSRTLRVDLHVNSRTGNYVHSYYLRNDGIILYNGSYAYNDGSTFDDSVVTQYNDGATYNSGVVYGGAEVKKYKINFEGRAQGFWARVRFYDASNNHFDIGDMNLEWVERGAM